GEAVVPVRSHGGFRQCSCRVLVAQPLPNVNVPAKRAKPYGLKSSPRSGLCSLSRALNRPAGAVAHIAANHDAPQISGPPAC
ncbi:MAG: hypothetical protein SVX38_09220, partial [Chloroflexota bacterium]|nr:hypothetical protein [Chloroflexota bacterium]